MIRSIAAVTLLLVLFLSACRSPIASDDETSKDQPTTEVGLGVHSWPIFERDILEKGVRTDVLWPIASVRTNEEGRVQRADILFPIGRWEHDGSKTRFGLRPLFDVENQDTDKGHISDWDILWPLVGWRTAPDETRSHVFPLWWQRSSAERMYQVLFPLFWRGANTDKKWLHIWPLYGQWGNDNETKRYALWPFFWHDTNKTDERSEWDAFWPFFEVGHSRDGESSRALPFWWHKRSGEDEFSLLFPLWFHSKHSDTEKQFFGPFYGSVTSAKEQTKFFGGPLFISSKTSDGTEHSFDILWPMFHHASRANGQTTRIFPLLWSETKGDSGYFHAWPFFGRSWDAMSTETSTIWPLFTFEHWTDGDYAVNAPWPLVKFVHEDTHRQVRIFPLFSHESDSADGSFDTNIGILFNRSLSDDGEHATTLFPFYSSSGNADGSYEGNAGYFLADWDGDGKGKGTFHILWRLVQDDDVKIEEAGVMHSKHIFAINPFYRSEENDRGDTSWSVFFSLLKRTQKSGQSHWRVFWFFGDA